MTVGFAQVLAWRQGNLNKWSAYQLIRHIICWKWVDLAQAFLGNSCVESLADALRS